MERPKQSSLNSPDESKAISTKEDFGTLVKETSSYAPKRVSKKVVDGSNEEKEGKEEPDNRDDDEEEDPIYEDEDYDEMEPYKKPEGKKKHPKSHKHQGKEKRKGDCTRRKGNRVDKRPYAYIS